MLRTRKLLRAGGILVVEQPTELAAAALPEWDMLRDRAYGHTRLVVYRLQGDGSQDTSSLAEKEKAF